MSRGWHVLVAGVLGVAMLAFGAYVVHGGEVYSTGLALPKDSVSVADEPLPEIEGVRLELAVFDPGAYPTFSAEFVNESDRAVVLVTPAESSLHGNPQTGYEWMVVQGDGSMAREQEPMIGCGVMLGPSIDNYVVLEPGERLPVGDALRSPENWWQLREPGIYQVRLRYLYQYQGTMLTRLVSTWHELLALQHEAENGTVVSEPIWLRYEKGAFTQVDEPEADA